MWPTTSMRAEAKALEQIYVHIAREGSAQVLLPLLQTCSELWDRIRYREYEAMDSTILKRALPKLRS
jgi:methylisocitrate lyase